MTATTIQGPRWAAVYDRLRWAIIRGEIRPNERLIETDLAARLQASRTPVREALQRLAMEGLVSTRRRGWIAREHTPAEIRDIYGVRGALEGYACHLAALHAPDAQLQAVLALHRDRHPGGQDSSFQHLVNSNECFHDAISAASGNARLVDLIQRNRHYYFNYNIARLYSNEEAEAALAGHERIVQALLARDADAAERRTREHVEEALWIILAKLPYGFPGGGPSLNRSGEGDEP